MISEWADYAQEVLDDPLYQDRIEWEKVEKLLVHSHDLAQLANSRDALAPARMYGWDIDNESAWSGVNFALLGTTKGGKIPRKPVVKEPRLLNLEHPGKPLHQEYPRSVTLSLSIKKSRRDLKPWFQGSWIVIGWKQGSWNWLKLRLLNWSIMKFLTDWWLSTTLNGSFSVVVLCTFAWIVGRVYEGLGYKGIHVKCIITVISLVNEYVLMFETFICKELVVAIDKKEWGMCLIFMFMKIDTIMKSQVFVCLERGAVVPFYVLRGFRI